MAEYLIWMILKTDEVSPFETLSESNVRLEATALHATEFIVSGVDKAGVRRG